VVEPAAFAAYRAVAAPILTAPGRGERLVTTTETIDLNEAAPVGATTVVLRFPSVAAATEAYRSAGYQAVLGERLDATTPRVAMIVPTLD